MHYWMARSLGLAAALVILVALVAYALDLVFVPPSAELSSAWAPHWRAYVALWDIAEQVGRSGLTEGVFPSTIRTFDKDGLPAFLPWIIIGLALGALAMLALVVMLLTGRRYPNGQNPVDAIASSPEDEQDDSGLDAGRLPIPPTSIRAAPGLIREPSLPIDGHKDGHRVTRPSARVFSEEKLLYTPRSEGAPWPDEGARVAVGRIESGLYASEQALTVALNSLEDVRRAALNLVLDPAVAQANQDLKEVHDALDDLEMAFEHLRGQQHALMAELVQLDGQAAPR